MNLRGEKVSDSDSRHDAAKEPRLGEEDLSRAVDQVDQTLIGKIQLSRRQLSMTRSPSKTHNAEGYGRHAFEVRMFVDPGRQLLSQPHMRSQALADGLRPKRTKDHPQLQCSKSPAELDSSVHQVARLATFRSLKILRRERERSAHEIHAAAVEGAQIKRREKPFVGIDDKRMGAFGTVEDMSVGRNHSRHSGIGGIDV